LIRAAHGGNCAFAVGWVRYKGLVFLAEGEDALRLSAEALLQSVGYLVLSARDGKEALARMRGASAPAVALVDLAMSGMDGHSLIAAMRADAELSHIPVIAMSKQREMPEPPVEGFVLKPYASSELVAAVNALCR
jgi:CheY-like chemotaxis protein